MNCLQNSLRNIQTTIAGLVPLAIGGYLFYHGIKSGNLQQMLEGAGYFAGGAGLVAAKDAGKSGTIVNPK